MHLHNFGSLVTVIDHCTVGVIIGCGYDVGGRDTNSGLCTWGEGGGGVGVG